jgi:multimeric flavodoxin WrbA
MNPIKCLGIGCSPRSGGNTSLLLAEAMKAAQEAGAACETIFLREYKFSPCIACDGCHLNGNCVLKDDMQLIYEKLLAADRIILAAPIFSMGMNAQGKALVDRGQRFWATKYVLGQQVIVPGTRPKRQGIFLSAAGTDLSGVFDCAVRTVKYYFKMLDVEYIREYCYTKIDAKGEILTHPSALAEVNSAGAALVEDRH